MRIAPLFLILAVLTLPAGADTAATTQPASPAASSSPTSSATTQSHARTAATRPAPIYVDPATGFSIVPPKFTDNLQQRTVVFYAPAQNGSAATVNILVDPTKTNRRDYVATSMRALSRNDARVNSARELQVAGYDAELLDYEATMNVRRLRFLQLIVVTEDMVYIVTCTATAETFEQNHEAFQKCLDSFRPPAK